MRTLNPFLLLLVLLTSLLSGCGGGASSTTGGGSTPSPVALNVQLLTDNTQLASDGATPVTVTALIRDANQNAVAEQVATFSSTDTGVTITPLATKTDSTGRISATVTTLDPTNRTVTITATAAGNTATTSVAVTGTVLAISGTGSVVTGNTTAINILAKDSAGKKLAGRAVTVSTTRNTLTAAGGTVCTGSGFQLSCTTDTNGNIAVTLTGTTPGTDTLTATGLGVSATLAVDVSGNSFVFTTPTPGTTPEYGLGTSNNAISVRYFVGGSPAVGTNITFSTTRGGFAATPGANMGPATLPATTNASGIATVYIRSDSLVGGATITAAVAGGPSAQAGVEFISTTPANMTAQATPTTLSVSRAGAPASQSEIIATIRDAQNNPVKNIPVTFSLTADASGGSLGAGGTATTDSFGRASVFYTSGPNASGQDGVTVTASAAGVASKTVNLTVSGTVFMVIGFDNTLKVSPSSSVVYEKEFVVLVTDSAGNPVGNQTVNLQMAPTNYEKGEYRVVGDKWVKGGFNPGPAWSQGGTRVCANEDANNNGILDPGEDFNTSGFIEPKFVGAIAGVGTNASATTTDSNGFGRFIVSYPKNVATWVDMRIIAKTTLGGSESSDSLVLNLPVLASDISNKDVSPPNQFSPFGILACNFDG